MIKEQIILTAFDLFAQYGIKSVSMDDIARTLSVSKRTLYGFFEDKEALLIEGLESKNEQSRRVLEEIEKGDYTAIDVILLYHEEQMKRPQWYSQKFYEDLKKYPRAMLQKEEQKDAFTQKCTTLFKRGVREGVFQQEVNFEIMAILAKDQFKMLQPSKSFRNHSNADVYNTVLITFLRGICTEKGRQILDRWIQAKKISRA